MRPLPLVAAIYCFSCTALFAAKDSVGTALNAIRLLPRGESKRIVRVEARDGTPTPERWHIIVHDPKDENGVHEYVIAGGEVVASRSISQFVESVKAEDIVKDSLIKIDSDRLAELAQQYAGVNRLAIASINYVLKKEGADAAPLWSVVCLDDTGKQVGVLVVSAGKGNIISHEGFTAEPGPEVLVRAETQGETQAEREERLRNQKKTFVRTPTAATPAPEKKDVMSRVGNSISKFFTGKNKP